MILSHLWRTDSVWVLLVQFTYRVIWFVSTHLKLVHEGLIWFSRRTDSCGSVYIQGDSVCEWFKAPPRYTPCTTVSKPETSTPLPMSHLCVSFTLPDIMTFHDISQTSVNSIFMIVWWHFTTTLFMIYCFKEYITFHSRDILEHFMI